ncbi:MAG: TatD family hydrolase [Candidatus Delongbacteria bacterium]|nr:TatD family hydrolase [Candidatus Delongbacteria bacterium]
MSYIDLHCHWDDVRFTPRLSEMIGQGIRQGIACWISSALDPDSVADHLEWQKIHPQILISMGIHPFDLNRASSMLGPMEEAVFRNPPQAIGECGLDFYDGTDQRPAQTELFLHQARWAKIIGRPIILHIRKGYYEFRHLLNQHPFLRDLPMIFHSFSGPESLIPEFLRYNLYFSFSGAFTAPRAQRLHQKLAMIPLSRLLLETDAPYIRPFDFPGEYNTPLAIIPIYHQAAHRLGLEPDRLREQLLQNFQCLFTLPD